MQNFLLHDFNVIELIGKGHFSQVYLTESKRKPTTRYALKKINKVNNRGRIDRELNALKIMGQYYDHMRLVGTVNAGGEFYIVMEYAEGETLGALIKRSGPISEEFLYDLTKAMIRVLRFTQSHNLLHLDIKTSNIFLQDGNYYLFDWGLSEPGKYAATLYARGNPPEAYRIGKRGFLSEIYSLGFMLYYAATGRYPFWFRNGMVREQKAYSNLYFPAQYPASLPSKTIYLLSRMLEKAPEDRATLDELEAILNNDIEPRTVELFPELASQPNLDDILGLCSHMANDGVLYGQNYMGMVYLKGEHVTCERNKARHYFEIAAHGGYALAQHNYAKLLQSDGKNRDDECAFYWFHKSAEQQLGKAQLELAKLYEQGRGVCKDKELAQHWYQKAAYNGALRKSVGA